MIHFMRLNPEPFSRVASGDKKFEYRLLDDKRKKVCLGDTIVFSNTENDRQQVQVRVTSMCYASDFFSLPLLIARDGLVNRNDFNPRKMYEYYTEDDINKYGVCAIGIKLIENINEESNENTDKASLIVAEYILRKIIRSKCSNGNRAVEKAINENKRYTVKKLNWLFRPEALELMAHYVHLLNKSISEEEFNDIMSLNTWISKSEVIQLLDCAMKIKYLHTDIDEHPQHAKSEEEDCWLIDLTDDE